MKKILSFLLVSFLFSNVWGQTIVYNDNFDSYNANAFLVEQNSVNWTTWSGEAGGNDDAYISTETAASSPNSLRITGESDILYPFENLTSGHYTIQFDWYIVASGHGGYFNILHNNAGNNSKWAFECFVDAAGNGVLIVEGVNTSFTYPPNSWIPVMLTINLDIDSIFLHLNQNLIKAWKFSSDAGTTTPATCQLAAINFYAGCMDNLNQSNNFGTYFVDNFIVSKIEEDTKIRETDEEDICLFPNPVINTLTITLPTNTQQCNLSLFSIDGKLIEKQLLKRGENYIDISHLINGVYFLKLENKTTSRTFKVIKN